MNTNTNISTNRKDALAAARSMRNMRIITSITTMTHAAAGTIITITPNAAAGMLMAAARKANANG